MIKSTIAKNAACNAVVQLVDTGAVNVSGQLNIFTVDSTNYPGDATAMAYLPLANPAFAAAVDGTSTAHTIADATALRDGTASWFNVVNRDAVEIWRGSISTFSGTGDLRFQTTTFPMDTTVSITTAQYVVPA